VRGPAQGLRRSRLALWLLLPVLVAAFGVAGGRAPVVSAQPSGAITIQKQLVDPQGVAIANPPAGALSGYSFSITPQGGGNPIPLGVTNAQGQLTVGVPFGSYFISETLPAGAPAAVFIVNNQQSIGFTLSAASPTVTIIAQNKVAGTAGIVVTKQILDANNTVLANVDRSGFQFTVANASGFTQTLTTDANGVANFINLATGSYTVTEASRSGFTFVSLVINNVTSQNGASVTVSNGSTAQVIAQNRQGTAGGTVTVTKQIVDPNNAVISTASRSGFSFTLACGGVFSQTAATDANGGITFSNVPAGTCTLTEASTSGFVFVGATLNAAAFPTNGGSFTVAAGQTSAFVVQNRQGTAGNTVTITKQIVDANNAVVTTADRSGFSFTLACGSAFSQTIATDANGAVTFSSVPAGSCTLSETPRSGFSFVGATLNNAAFTNGGSFTVTAAGTNTFVVQNRQGTATGNTEPIQLFTGCNNIAITFAAGTSYSTVAAGISPSGILLAIWRYNNATQTFAGFSPIPNAPNDLNTVGSRGEPVFICVTGGGTFNRPVI